MTRSLRQRLDRRLDGQRVRAFSAAACTLLLIAGGLSLTAGNPTQPGTADREHDQPEGLTPHRSRAQVAAPVPSDQPAAGLGSNSGADVDRAAVERQARRFLAGYLRYLYGRGSAAEVAGATTALRQRLIAAQLRVSPAARRRHPNIVGLQTRLLGGRRWHVVATIADGGASRYPIELLLKRAPDGPVVSAVVSE